MCVLYLSISLLNLNSHLFRQSVCQLFSRGLQSDIQWLQNRFWWEILFKKQSQLSSISYLRHDRTTQKQEWWSNQWPQVQKSGNSASAPQIYYYIVFLFLYLYSGWFVWWLWYQNSQILCSYEFSKFVSNIIFFFWLIIQEHFS